MDLLFYLYSILCENIIAFALVVNVYAYFMVHVFVILLLLLRSSHFPTKDSKHLYYRMVHFTL